MTEIHLEHALRVLGRHTVAAATEALAPLGLTPAEYDIMEVISRYMDDPDGLNFNNRTISRLVGIHYATCADQLGRLQRSGLVRMTGGWTRLLTAKGLDTLAECRWRLREANREMQRHFEDYGLENLAEALLSQQKEVL